MALDENGVLWGWGNNHHWQITPPPASLVNARGEVTVYADGYENGRYLYVKRPTKIVVSGPDGQPVVFRRFSSRFTVTVGIDDQGHAWSWGQNYDLAAGRGVGTLYNVVAGRMANVGDRQFVDVDTGFRHGMLLQYDGTIVGWGNNSHTVLGGTQSQDPSQPVTVEARGSQATPATDPTAQDVAPYPNATRPVRMAAGMSCARTRCPPRWRRAGAWRCWPVPACCCAADR